MLSALAPLVVAITAVAGALVKVDRGTIVVGRKAVVTNVNRNMMVVTVCVETGDDRRRVVLIRTVCVKELVMRALRL